MAVMAAYGSYPMAFSLAGTHLELIYFDIGVFHGYVSLLEDTGG